MSKEQELYRIRQSAFIARIAAWVLKERSMAIVIGRTIYLHGVSDTAFLQNERWLRHELTHVQQFREHGFLLFIARYLWESAQKGYYHNKYEVEARAAETPS